MLQAKTPLVVAQDRDDTSVIIQNACKTVGEPESLSGNDGSL